ncbi:MAG TPA: GDSL-type esterase/lipase family protein, partial [Chitinophaga sp.]
MPDKHSNNKPEVSEELIRQYLAGELDDKAMHALERQALDDPFLAEALEGYAGHEPDQSAQLADLQQRLEQRVAQADKGKLRLLYYRWASAAAILVLLGLSFLWINRQQSAELQKNIAKTEETQPAPRTYKATDTTRQALVPPDAATPTGPLASKKAPLPVAVPPPVPAGELKKDHTPEVALEAAKARDTAMAAVTEKIAAARWKEDTVSTGLLAEDNAVAANVAAQDQPVTIASRGISGIQPVLQGKAAGVTVSPSERFFNGRVVDKESGEPVPGVNVIAGNKAVITDSKGAFAISMDTTESPSLKLASIGYNSRQLSFRQQENNVTVALEPSKAALSEVVVVGMGRLSGRAKRARKAYLQRQPAKSIVVLGSSTAAGTGPKTPDSAWVNLLRKYLQSDDSSVTVTNLAVGGFTSYKILPEGGDLPFYKPKPDPEHNIDMALSLKPDLIIINMPSNDITEGFSVEDFRKNLQVVTDLIRQQNIRFYITTTQPRNTTAANRKKLRQMRDIIMRSYRNNYIDCWDELSTPDG